MSHDWTLGRFGAFGLSLISSGTLGVAAPPILLQFGDLQIEAPAGAPPIERFREAAATQLGVASAEVAVDRVDGPITLQDSGLVLYVASGTVGDRLKALVALTPSGESVDFRAALELDRAMAVAARGKVTRRLLEEAVQRPARERMLIVAWIEAPGGEDLRAAATTELRTLEERGELTHEIADARAASVTEAIRARIAPRTEAVAERLRAARLQVVSFDDLSPLVFLQADWSEVSQIAGDPDVASIDWAGTEYRDRLNVGIAEVRANSVWSAPGGVTGVGAKVSIVESTRVCTTNPYMTVSATKNAAGAVGSHTTGVGSCVASTHPTYKGVAPGAALISANGADFVSSTTNVTTQMPGSVSAVSWSVTNGAHVLNLSYGAGVPGSTVSSFDKYLDYIARNNGRTIVPASGNSGGFAGDPGAGYNELTAGAFNDAGSSAWSGETMASFSSWQNPSTGLETPSVAAPGVGITMLTCSSPWTGYTANGTSFSAPITAGTAALVVSKQPALGSNQEPVRAIVMATAWHNIEGAAALSSRDGAGGVDALAAFRVAARGVGAGYNYGSLTPASFDASGFFTSQAVSVAAGQTVRVALVWNSTPSAGPTYSPDTLKADLDLYVYGPSGALVASSTSGPQPFEVVQFAATTAGTYTVRIKNYSFTGTSEFFGTALTTSSDM